MGQTPDLQRGSRGGVDDDPSPGPGTGPSRAPDRPSAVTIAMPVHASPRRLDRNPGMRPPAGARPALGTITTRPPSARCVADDRVRPAEQSLGRPEVARRDRRADVGARTARPSSVERRARRRRRTLRRRPSSRRPRACRAGRDRTPRRASSAKPASAVRGVMPAHERVVFGRAQRRIEVLDHDHLDARLAEPLEPLGRVHQQRRRAPTRISSGCESNVMTAGRAARGRLLDEVLGRSTMAEMDPVEHADDGEQRPVAPDAGRRRPGRARSGPGIRGPRDRSASTRTLSGASRPSRIGRSRRAGRRRRRTRIGASERRAGGQPARRSTGPRPIATTSPSRDDELRQQVQPGIDRQQERGERIRAFGGGRADASSAIASVQPERAARRPASARRGTRHSRPPRRGRARATGCTCPPSTRRRRSRSARSGSRAVPLDEVERVDRHVARRELDRLAGPGHRVGPPAGDLDRAVGRRALLDRAAERGQRRLDGARARAPARRPASARPRGRRSSTTRRSRPSPDSALRSPRWYSTSARRLAEEDRAARRSRTDRASRRDRPASSPPAGGRAPTTSCDVGPAGFATTRMPSSRAIGAPSAGDGDDEPLGLGEHRAARLGDRQRDRRAGRPGVPAAAERAGQDRRVDAAGLRPDADPGRLPASLNTIATSASSDWASRSMIPSECGGDRAGRGEIRVEQASSGRSARRPRLSSRSRTRPNSRSWASGFER